MTQPAITVVMPARNAARWIGETLTSVIGQTCASDRLDVIVVDDGSDDGTSDVARSILEASALRYHILRNDTALGPSASRNRGWRQAGTEWIQFLDADDLLAPGKIARQLDEAVRCGPEVAALYSPWTHIDEQGGPWGTAYVFDPKIGDDPECDLLASEHFMATGSQIFRRAWLERVGGYVETHRYIEDVELLLNISAAGGHFVRVPAPAPQFFYRRRAGSLSASDADAVIEGCVRNASAVERRWEAAGALTPARGARLAESYYVAARHYATRDPLAFSRSVEALQRVAPDFRPSGPPALRLLSKYLGYANAERVAVQYRRLKNAVAGEQAGGPAGRG